MAKCSDSPSGCGWPEPESGSIRRARGPHNRSTPTDSRAVILYLCVLVLGAAIGYGQPVPDTILLPDSLGPLRPGYHLAFGSSTDNIYVTSESSDIIVVDGNTFQRIKRINTGTSVGGALLVSQHNRVYCSYPRRGRIGIIDCATNDTVGSIQVGTRPTSLCYSSGSDKLYCGDTIDHTISVVDCATNTVLKVISVGNGLTAMAYDPTSSKLYAATKAAVLAISCSSDSLIASINAIKSARGLLVNKRRQKLYVVAGHFSPCPDTELYVVSTKTDSLIHPIVYTTAYDTLARYLACNETTDRLYAFEHDVNGYNYVLEFDCSGDTYTRYSDGIGGTACVGSACDTFRNRVYFLTGGCFDYYGCLMELDCSSWTFVDWDLDGNPPILGFDPSHYRVMCAGGQSSERPFEGTLAVFDCKHDSTAVGAVAPLFGWEWHMYHNPATSRLYFCWGSSVGVIDEQTNRLVGQTFLPSGAIQGNTGVAYSRTSDKFYYWTRDGLGVMDGARDSFLKVIPIGYSRVDPWPCWCPDGNKVYCFSAGTSGYKIDVIDCNTDSVVRQMDVYKRVSQFQYLGNGRMLCDKSDSLSIIDTRTDSVLVDSSLSASAVYAVSHTGDGQKVYLLRAGRVEARSSISLSLLATINWPYDGGSDFLVYSDTTKRLYWSNGDSILAIDGTKDSVVARLKNVLGCFDWHNACLDHSGRYLFCTTYYDSTLRVYDTQKDSLVGLYTHLPYPIGVTTSPEQRCIYVGCQDVILAYPDAPPGVCEQPATSISSRPPQTIVRGVLLLPEASSHKLQATSCLLDVSGRKVMDVKPGSNDVRALAPGVYFVREASGVGREASSVAKVVVTH